MKPGNINLHIEEQVLHGFEPGDRYRIGQAVEQELGRLLTEGGAPQLLTRSGEVPRLDGGSFEAKPVSGVEAIGAKVARAVYGGLST